MSVFSFTSYYTRSLTPVPPSSTGWSGSPTPTAPSLSSCLLSAPAFPSVLSIFSAEGGLALLAGTLPLLFPEGGAPPPASGSGRTDRPPPADLTDADWVKVDQTEEDEYVSGLMPLAGGGQGGSQGGSGGGSGGVTPVMSPHSLACFGLFLRWVLVWSVWLGGGRCWECLVHCFDWI